jgi:hypothetical protein
MFQFSIKVFCFCIAGPNFLKCLLGLHEIWIGLQQVFLHIQQAADILTDIFRGLIQSLYRYCSLL